jgi:hypothetical protein
MHISESISKRRNKKTIERKKYIRNKIKKSMGNKKNTEEK